MSVESQTSFAQNVAQSPLSLEASEANATVAPQQFFIAEVAMVSSPVDVGGGLSAAEANALSPPLSNMRLTAPAPATQNALQAPLHGALTDYASSGCAAAPMYFQQQSMPSSQMPAVCAVYTSGMSAVRLSPANMYNSAPQAFAPPSVRASYPVQLPDNYDSLLVAQAIGAEGCNNLNSGVNYVQLPMPASTPAAVAPVAAPAAARADVGVAGLDDINEILNKMLYPNAAPLPPLQPAPNCASLNNQMFMPPQYAPQSSASFPSNASTISSQYPHHS